MTYSSNLNSVDLRPLNFSFGHFIGKVPFTIELSPEALTLSISCEKAKTKITFTTSFFDAGNFAIQEDPTSFVLNRYRSMKSLLCDFEAEHERLKALSEFHTSAFSLMEKAMPQQSNFNALSRFAELVADSGYDCGYSLSKLSPVLFKEGIFAVISHRSQFALADLFKGTKGASLYRDNGHNFLIDIIDQVMDMTPAPEGAEHSLSENRAAKRLYYCISFFAAMSMRWPELRKPVDGPLKSEHVAAFIGRWENADSLNDGRVYLAASAMQHIYRHYQSVMAGDEITYHHT